jgi:hypothetical protein
MIFKVDCLFLKEIISEYWRYWSLQILPKISSDKKGTQFILLRQIQLLQNHSLHLKIFLPPLTPNMNG